MNVEKSLLGIWLALASKISAILLLIINTIFWFHPDFTSQVAEIYSGVSASNFVLTANTQLIGWLISSLQLSVLSVALFAVSSVFQDFGKGLWFVERFSRKLKLFGGSLLLFSLLNPVIQALVSFTLTYSYPEGQRIIAFSFDSRELIISLVGVLLLLVGKVMDEAVHIADENKEII